LDELTALRIEQEKRFEQSNLRFEQMDQRFEQVDQRFEQMDQRFEQVDQRFEQMDRRFEQVDRRFEQVDRHFEQVDQRLIKIEGRLEGIDNKLIDLDSRLSYISEDLAGFKDFMRLHFGQFQTKIGKKMEDTIAGALRYALRRPDIQPSSIKLRQFFTDEQGKIFRPGKIIELDILAQDGELTIFEVKSAPKVSEIEYFSDKVDLVRLLQPDKKVSGVVVVLAAEFAIKKACDRLGLILVPEYKSTDELIGDG
jgi:hypothetical protein